MAINGSDSSTPAQQVVDVLAARDALEMMRNNGLLTAIEHEEYSVKLKKKMHRVIKEYLADPLPA